MDLTVVHETINSQRAHACNSQVGHEVAQPRFTQHAVPRREVSAALRLQLRTLRRQRLLQRRVARALLGRELGGGVAPPVPAAVRVRGSDPSAYTAARDTLDLQGAPSAYRGEGFTGFTGGRVAPPVPAAAKGSQGGGLPRRGIHTIHGAWRWGSGPSAYAARDSHDSRSGGCRGEGFTGSIGGAFVARDSHDSWEGLPADSQDS